MSQSATAVVRSQYPCCGKGARFRVIARLPRQAMPRRCRCGAGRRWLAVIRFVRETAAGVLIHSIDWESAPYG